jgi:hypothetical protein
MARIKNNVVMQGASGKIGNLVTRQQNGMTVSSEYKKPANPRTKQQQEGRGRFRRAVQYAKSAIAAPDTKALYDAVARQNKRTAYHTALSDYLSPPVVEQIGALPDSNEVHIRVVNVIAVGSVYLRLLNADGAQTEEGAARLVETGAWRYTSRENLQSGNRLEITVTDLPGNVAVCEWTC